MKAKKIVVILFIIIALFLAAAFVIPVLFKGELISKTKETINSQVNATVEFADLNISLFKSFPKVQLELEGLSITGKDQFQGDTLLAVSSIATDVSLGDLFKIRKEGLQVSSLSVIEAQINLLSTTDGFSNWDITLPVEKEDDNTESESSSTMAVALNDIDIDDLSLNFIDEATKTVIRLKNADLDAAGKLEGTVTNFDFTTEIEEFVLEYDSVQYIGNTVLKAESNLKADFDKLSFVLGESKVYLNDLPLDVSGEFAMPSDSMFFDLAFKQDGSDVNALLAMIPKDYQNYLEQISTSGEAGFEGKYKGWMYEDEHPAISSRIFLKNATLQYEGLPEKIENINLETSISKEQGELDLLEVLVSKAEARIRENPVNMNLHLTNLMSDLAFNGNFSGKINFDNLSNAIPMDSLELKGILDGNMKLSGTMSAIDEQDFERVKSSGAFKFANVSVLTPQISKPLVVHSGTVNITTPAILFDSFKANIGQSDFKLNGKLSNYLAYALQNQELKGDFSLNSNLLNLNELATLAADEQAAESDTTASETLAFHVPEKLDLSFSSLISRAIFDRMDIRNINGLIRVKDEKLALKQLDMDMLRGSLTVDGAYQNNPENKPEFDFNLNVKSFDIPAAYQSLSMMRRYMPIAAKSQGNISSQLKFKGRMDENLEIIASTLDGNGLFNTQNLMIVDSPTFNQIRGVIKKEKLKNVKVDDFTANFNIDNGNLLLKPFKTTIADQQTTIHGSLSAESILNMDMDFKLNREDLHSDINDALGFFPGSDNIKVIDATVKLKGALKNPDVSLDLSKARKQVQDEFKKSGKEEIQKKVKKLGDELKKLFN